MALIEQIDKDLVEAMKARDETKISTLRMLKSTIHNWQIASQKVPGDSDIAGIIQKEIKSRNDSIELYKKGARIELAQNEEKEVEILKKYLPKQIGDEEIRNTVKAAINQTGAQGPQDMGKVMGKAMSELKGKADGALVAKIVKEELSDHK